MLGSTHRTPLAVVFALSMIVTPLASLTPATVAEVSDPPTLEAFEWLPRTTDEDGDPLLRLSLTVNAPSGLAGGEVTVKGFNYQIVDNATLPAREAGEHQITLEISLHRESDRYKEFGREVTNLVLLDPDGERTEYDLCELADLGETREKPNKPRPGLECLPEGGGWTLWTVKATGPDAWAQSWSLGVSSGGGEAAGIGHVVQHGNASFEDWGVLVGRVGADHGDETYVRAAGHTIVNRSQPDDHPNVEIVIGAGIPEVSMDPGEVLTFATYFATEEAAFLNQRLSYLHGENVTVLDQQVGQSVGLFDTRDHDFDVRVRQTGPVAGYGAGAHALGQVNVTAEHSMTYYRAWFRGPQHRYTSASASSGQGPDGPLVGTYPVARSPGSYSWNVHASATTDPDADWVLAYADMPIQPNLQDVTSAFT